ncbi:MAG: hypothetical protein L0206_25540 [Actinobacteria bacterium]|nr:hypothetical protein [Actinomycetota bacterium]
MGCFDDAHIVATHPALAGLTDATLSNWSCSVHEGISSWPINFEVLVIAENAIGGNYNAPDGTIGFPYILARGVEVISDILLSPDVAVNPVGTDHTVTALVTTDNPGSGHAHRRHDRHVHGDRRAARRDHGHRPAGSTSSSTAR